MDAHGMNAMRLSATIVNMFGMPEKTQSTGRLRIGPTAFRIGMHVAAGLPPDFTENA
jgi:hypothetical protein